MGYFINADRIKATLESKKYLDCTEFFPGKIFNEEWEIFLNSHKVDERFQSIAFNGIQIKENF